MEKIRVISSINLKLSLIFNLYCAIRNNASILWNSVHVQKLFCRHLYVGAAIRLTVLPSSLDFVG
jgi:hypothetical protein